MTRICHRTTRGRGGHTWKKVLDRPVQVSSRGLALQRRDDGLSSKIVLQRLCSFDKERNAVIVRHSRKVRELLFARLLGRRNQSESGPQDVPHQALKVPPQIWE